MIEAYKQISKRLLSFIENNLEYYDDGNPESGPSLSSIYNGPEWPLRLEAIMDDDYSFWLMTSEFEDEWTKSDINKELIMSNPRFRKDEQAEKQKSIYKKIVQIIKDNQKENPRELNSVQLVFKDIPAGERFPLVSSVAEFYLHKALRWDKDLYKNIQDFFPDKYDMVEIKIYNEQSREGKTKTYILGY